MISFPLLHPRMGMGRISADLMLLAAVATLLFATDWASEYRDVPIDFEQEPTFDSDPDGASPLALQRYEAAVSGPGPMQALRG